MKPRTFPAGRSATALALALASLLPLRAAEPAEVVAARPRHGEITRFVALPGSLRANQQVLLTARVPGFVKRIPVDRGDRVQEGQLIAEIEVPELLAQLSRDQAELKVAEADLARLTSARSKSPDLVTPQALDAASGRAEIARAQLRHTETLLSYARITTPFAGTITERFVDPGAFVAGGREGAASALVRLLDSSTVRAVVPVPESDAVHVRPGQPVRVTVEGLGTNAVEATVSRHAAALDESTRSLVVEADLPNPAERLRPGMFATVRIGVETRTNALLVPADALITDRSGSFVFRIEGGVSRKTPVKPGFNDGLHAEIVSGLSPDASVIVPGRSAPPDGAAVKPRSPANP